MLPQTRIMAVQVPVVPVVELRLRHSPSKRACSSLHCHEDAQPLLITTPGSVLVLDVNFAGFWNDRMNQLAVIPDYRFVAALADCNAQWFGLTICRSQPKRRGIGFASSFSVGETRYVVHTSAMREQTACPAIT
jgi:hypothetical protein